MWLVSVLVFKQKPIKYMNQTFIDIKQTFSRAKTNMFTYKQITQRKLYYI